MFYRLQQTPLLSEYAIIPIYASRRQSFHDLLDPEVQYLEQICYIRQHMIHNSHIISISIYYYVYSLFVENDMVLLMFKLRVYSHIICFNEPYENTKLLHEN